MSETEMGKLQILLKHWIEHNQEHGKEFQEWAGKAKDFGENAVSDNILKAVGKLEEANTFLRTALGVLTEKKS